MTSEERMRRPLHQRWSQPKFDLVSNRVPLRTALAIGNRRCGTTIAAWSLGITGLSKRPCQMNPERRENVWRRWATSPPIFLQSWIFFACKINRCCYRRSRSIMSFFFMFDINVCYFFRRIWREALCGGEIWLQCFENFLEFFVFFFLDLWRKST